MRLVVRCNLGFGGAPVAAVDLPEGATLRDLLIRVAEREGHRLFTADRARIVDEVHIAVNGRDYLFIPAQAEAALRDGDQVDIYFYPLGGG